MPGLRQKLLIEDAFTASHTAARALVRPGRRYEEAVEMFSPYQRVKEEYPSARQALRDLVVHSVDRDIAAYIHVNNGSKAKRLKRSLQ